MSLRETDRKEVVKKSLDNAKRIFSEIPILVENELYGNAAGRLYYACFHAISALLISDNFNAKTHDGINRLLGEHYLKTGKIDRSIGTAFSQMSSFRTLNDYGNWKLISGEKIKLLVTPARVLIDTVEKLIQNSQKKHTSIKTIKGFKIDKEQEKLLLSGEVINLGNARYNGKECTAYAKVKDGQIEISYRSSAQKQAKVAKVDPPKATATPKLQPRRGRKL